MISMRNQPFQIFFKRHPDRQRLAWIHIYHLSIIQVNSRFHLSYDDSLYESVLNSLTSQLQTKNCLGSIAAYSQHAGFPSSGYGFPTNDFFEKTSNLPHMQPQSQAFGAANPPIIHMPSPNYPYGYNEHHRRQNYMPSDFAFFPNHHGMFDHR